MSASALIRRCKCISSGGLASFLLGALVAFAACIVSTSVLSTGTRGTLDRVHLSHATSRARNHKTRGVRRASDDGLCATQVARYAPLYGEQWLDRAVLNITLPPALGLPVVLHAYVTKRPEGAYAHIEFWDFVRGASWEPETFAVLRSALSARRGVYVDIGAWIGPTVLYAAHIAERVYALEPDPRAFSELHANVRLNPSVAQKVTLFRHCISATSGTVTMTGPAPLGSSMSRVAGVAAIPARVQDEMNWGDRMVSYPADCSSVADWAADVALSPRDVSLVKIDTEGAEVAVLASLLAWLREAPRAEWPPLFVSLHPGFWSDPDGRAWSRIMDVVKEYPVVLRKQGNVMVTINTESGNACSDLCELLCSDTPLVAA